ncbi:MAG: hypothetical protein Fur0025_24500 [Oscillatoriaceae cyanobacterium]
MVAANLLQKAAEPLRIALIERSSEFGRGVAYGTQTSRHLLNVRAGNMSAFADDPDHFLKWLHRNGYGASTASSFLPRQVYGDYLGALLKEAETNAGAGVVLQRIVGEAVAIETTAGGMMIYLKEGECLWAEKVVLAIGNFPASLPEPIAALENRELYVTDGWDADAFAGLGPEDSILIVGTGLTMADAIATLDEKGFQGQIYAVSRHGLMPCRHQPKTFYPPFLDPETAPKTARGLLHLVREEVRSAAAKGQDWRGKIDAIRPVTQQLWQALPLCEQKRFLRHVKADWEVHRHRIAEEIAMLLDTAIQSGQLKHYAGRILNCREFDHQVAVTIRERGTETEKVLLVSRIINCTGSNCNYRQLQHPLLASLQEQNLIRFNELSIGIDTTPNGAVIDTNGKVSEMLWTLGTPRKGNLWETTAVPEIRVQAANLAQELLKPFNPKAPTPVAEDWSAGNLSLLWQRPTLLLRQLFDKESSTYTYLIADRATKAAILVEPVLEQVDRDLQLLQELNCTLCYCLETHIHADHITGTDKLRALTDCLSVLPENAPANCANLYLGDGKILDIGSIHIIAIATPGHTDSHNAYMINDTYVLTGDSLLIRGCGRTDFQNGNPGLLYDAVTQKLFTLPDDTLVYPCHDYKGQTVSTIGEEKCCNLRLAGRSRSQFIELMNSLNLPYPQKMLEAVSANQRCGQS